MVRMQWRIDEISSHRRKVKTFSPSSRIKVPRACASTWAFTGSSSSYARVDSSISSLGITSLELGFGAALEDLDICQ